MTNRISREESLGPVNPSSIYSTNFVIILCFVLCTPVKMFRTQLHTQMKKGKCMDELRQRCIYVKGVYMLKVYIC